MEQEKAREHDSGRVRISEDVVEQIAQRALAKVIGIRPAELGAAFSGSSSGKKPVQGVSVSFEEGEPPSISIEAFIKTKYGLRIPDICWYVQESLRSTLEQFTGYDVKAVDVFTQGVYFDEQP
ncbi:MAG: Asp23/Gls24 family envelope stress response protein [Thermovirgaceae bacterium]|jgi:uncharacterized alkaline shock family protein YloU|nr:Asp23/Gls24 family envelope stress response protein [Thermovirga sp.]